MGMANIYVPPKWKPVPDLPTFFTPYLLKNEAPDFPLDDFIPADKWREQYGDIEVSPGVGDAIRYRFDSGLVMRRCGTHFDSWMFDNMWLTLVAATPVVLGKKMSLRFRKVSAPHGSVSKQRNLAEIKHVTTLEDIDE